jgi:hypothetical protein
MKLQQEGIYKRGPRTDKPNTKLEPSDVVKIRQMAQKGISYKAISDLFDITSANIHFIVYNKTWRDVGGPIKGQDYS